jgi:2-oxoglutarate dehydrogenase E1 component
MSDLKNDTADAFRRWGYLDANLDTLGRLLPIHHPDLDRSGDDADRLRGLYCGSIGVEFMHMPDPERCRWIAGRMESPAPEPDHRAILKRLVEAETFERVLQARYVGAKRYSLEGATALIPLLDEIAAGSIAHEARQLLIAMSHRGRLNVVRHIVGRSAADIFAGFEDVDPRSVLGGGDVKYHLGATGEYRGRDGGSVRVFLVSNPSHLEAVDPVAMGRVRAKQDRPGGGGADAVIPVVLHGDAAFAGQGIAAETLNMAGLRGYTVGGTIHVIVNNLIGFTTLPNDLHTSRYASDMARRLPIPIIHVNGEDPDAVVRAARLAVDYRFQFHSDVLLDLIAYRRHGHSEVDDPTITQPVLYRKIGKHPLLWTSYAEAIGVPAGEAEAMMETVRTDLDNEQERARALTTQPAWHELPEYWSGYHGGAANRADLVDTSVSAEVLETVAHGITTAPEGFTVHPKVRRGLDHRLEMGLGRRPVDWGAAEALAFGSLLLEGTPVRLSGQDCRRGTFNHRQAILVDFETGAEYLPLVHLSPEQARFQCYDSPLSEASVLGFEYGFSRDYPEALVLWEAQFGDFVNGAQVIIDQFVSATEDKWNLLSGLVLLLPHGYEGQGPEHSSARLERFLQLAGEDNIWVAQPTTAAQYFHLLRRQVLRKLRKPLIVMTPKSLLRSPGSASPLERLTGGRFEPILVEADVNGAERLLLCSGKVAYELEKERKRRKDTTTTIVRVEQLHPFPEEELSAEIARHPALREILWVQEEPANMGAFFFVQPRLARLVSDIPVRSVKRSASASPATSSHKAHEMEQAALLALAFAGAEGPADEDVPPAGEGDAADSVATPVPSESPD